MITLTVRESLGSLPIFSEDFSPSRLCALSPSEIERRAIRRGNRKIPLAECFVVQQTDNDVDTLVFRGATSSIDALGAGMTKGKIVVEGNAGANVGAKMTGGEIVVQGDCGPFAGAEMVNGRIIIKGNADDYIGAAYAGSRKGMADGVILVHGSAGSHAGSRMRRGLIAIGKSCGDYAGHSMLAGTIIIGGEPGSSYGAEMKRGTIILHQRPSGNDWRLPTFVESGPFAATFADLYFRKLRDWKFPVEAHDQRRNNFVRFRGDLLTMGKGEILVNG